MEASELPSSEGLDPYPANDAPTASTPSSVKSRIPSLRPAPNPRHDGGSGLRHGVDPSSEAEPRRSGVNLSWGSPSFFSLLQKNVLNRQRWQTRDQLRLAIVIWIEQTYHRRRRQDTLGRMTPIEYETITQAAHAA